MQAVKKRRTPFVFRIEKGVSDIIFIAHCIGIIGNVLWLSKWNQSDMVGFMAISSNVSVIFSSFFLFLFGSVLGFISPSYFWRAFVTVNYGIALVVLAISRSAGNELLLLLALIMGALVAKLIAPMTVKKPRLALVCFLVLAGILHFLLFRGYTYRWASAIWGLAFCFLGGGLIGLKFYKI